MRPSCEAMQAAVGPWAFFWMFWVSLTQLQFVRKKTPGLPEQNGKGAPKSERKRVPKTSVPPGEGASDERERKERRESRRLEKGRSQDYSDLPGKREDGPAAAAEKPRGEEYQTRYRSDPNLARYPVKAPPEEQQMRMHARVSRARHERRHSDVALPHTEAGAAAPESPAGQRAPAAPRPGPPDSPRTYAAERTAEARAPGAQPLPNPSPPAPRHGPAPAPAPEPRAPEPLRKQSRLDPSSAVLVRKAKREKAETMLRNDSLSSDQSESVRPSPPKPHRPKRGGKKRQMSVSSSEEEGVSTPEYTSCEDVELESESVSEKGLEEWLLLDHVSTGVIPAVRGLAVHRCTRPSESLLRGGGFRKALCRSRQPASSPLWLLIAGSWPAVRRCTRPSESLRRSHGTDAELRRHWRHELSVLLAQSATPATLSPAPCTSCWPNRGRSGVMPDKVLDAELLGPLKACQGRDLDYYWLDPATWHSRETSPISSHPVTWQPSKEGDRLIGRVILNKRTTMPKESGALLGLKVVGGKMTDLGRLGAFITKVKKGSLADVVGHLRAGDEVLEWNGKPLPGATNEEVYNIILESKSEPQVEIIVSRPIGAPVCPQPRSCCRCSHTLKALAPLTPAATGASSGCKRGWRYQCEQQLLPQSPLRIKGRWRSPQGRSGLAVADCTH
ncbi:hypothetical protein QTO34_001376 [Cnephaeus nilssonii]|uniref:PDZ domain-containing protein n=1 Tax=Cnephaeus nilssonii TaxID=3371016 RepID=A0AA40HVK3_CNENI|nr:hypothetical protein QTO34_001376 [Eptesicus nilssonii]